MSNRLLSLVFGGTEFGPGQSESSRVLVMLALADRVSDADVDFCYPSLADISARTRLSRSTVKRTLADLNTAGWISMTHRPAYGNIFRLNVEMLEASQRPARERRRASSRLSRPTVDQPTVGPLELTGPPSHLKGPTCNFLNKKNPKEPNYTPQRSRAAEATASPKPKTQPDPRHTAFRNAVEQALRKHNCLVTWGPAEAAQLANLLRDSPELTEATFTRLLQNLAASDGGTLHQRPCTWLPTLQRYHQGPLDRYGRPKTDATITNPSERKSALERYRESIQ